jgi:tetratricopeptide (TPR) repeat protein
MLRMPELKRKILSALGAESREEISRPISLYYAWIKIHHMFEQSGQLRTRAFQARRENRLDDAKQDLIAAVALSREAHDDTDLAKSLTALGQIERDLHDYAAALKNYEEAVALYRRKADVQRLAHTIRHLADIHRHTGNTQLAETCYREALDLYRADAGTGQLDLANAIRGYAILKADTSDTVQAKLLWEEAGKLYAAVGVHEGVAESMRRLTLLA